MAELPEWDTKSTSVKPGVVTSQCSVRMGMWLLSNLPGLGAPAAPAARDGDVPARPGQPELLRRVDNRLGWNIMWYIEYLRACDIQEFANS